jgi:hypothetical protein
VLRLAVEQFVAVLGLPRAITQPFSLPISVAPSLIREGGYFCITRMKFRRVAGYSEGVWAGPRDRAG